MKMSLVLASMMFCGGVSTLAAEENKADPRKKLETAIPHAIKLLKEKKVGLFLKRFVSPMDLKKFTSRNSFEDLLQGFQGKKADALLKVLVIIKSAKPEYNDDKTKASFKVEKKNLIPRDRITFKKEGKYWYIQN